MTDLAGLAALRLQMIPDPPGIDPASFAAHLIRFRKAHQPYLSQSQLGNRIGADHSYISRLEGDNRMPSREMVDKIAKALELDDDDKVRLLESAGFIDRELSSIHDPMLLQIDQALRTGSVSDNTRQAARVILQAALTMLAEDTSGDQIQPALPVQGEATL